MKENFINYLNPQNEEYEKQLLSNPYSLNLWLKFIQHVSNKNRSLNEQCFVYERCLKLLPRCFKIWKMYLNFRVNLVVSLNPIVYYEQFEKVNKLFEKALILLNKMPRIWLNYLQFLLLQNQITKTRKIFDQSLQALPLTQHDRIWDLYLIFAKRVGGVSEATIWQRYIQYNPNAQEEYIEVMEKLKKFDLAAKMQINIINDPSFISSKDKSSFHLCTELDDNLVNNKISLIDNRINVEDIIVSQLNMFPDQQGKLWVTLATYFILLNNFEKARDTFEKGITTVMTIKDFSLIFDAYAEFCETEIAQLMESIDDENNNNNNTLNTILDIRMLSFEQLMDRRPFLINDLLLRQDPNNVTEWIKRANLWSNNNEKMIETYVNAIATVNPYKAKGNFSELWFNFAKIYEDANDLPNARTIYSKAVSAPYKTPNELADVWMHWAEVELTFADKGGGYDKAISVLKTAVKSPKVSNIDYFDDSLSPQQRIHKSLKLWTYYIDLSEGIGDVKGTRELYDRVIELRIVTPLIIINYADFLEEYGYHEDSFRAYERGLGLFTYPVAFEIWNIYLTKAMKRKIGIERLRDLFEQAISNCPQEFRKTIYILYTELEKEQGLIENALEIFAKAVDDVPVKDKFSIFELYISTVAENHGLVSTRPIYEKAIGLLPDKDSRKMCLSFAEIECQLGEIDRAREIYGYGSQFADPRVSTNYWNKWNEFEVHYGNEDTFKEMLRVKRSVQAKFNTDINFVAAQAISLKNVSNTDGSGSISEVNNQTKQAPKGFVLSTEATSKEGPQNHDQTTKNTDTENPDAIDIEV